MDPGKVKKIGGPKEAAYMAIAVVIVIALIAGIVYLIWKNPSFFSSIANLILLIIAAVIVIGLAFTIVSMVIGIGYFAKGTTVQTDMSYDIDDVKPVDGSMLDEKDKKD